MVIASATTLEEAPELHLIAEKSEFTLPHAEKSAGRIVPIEHGPDSKVDFGAYVYGIDLNKFTDADFELISDALHKHKLLVFKEQPQMLAPQRTSNPVTAKEDGLLTPDIEQYMLTSW
jgi:hypothetical protein